MSSFTSPARVRFPRSSVTGKAPTVLAPGSLAVNYADKKIYVGDVGGTAVRFTQMIEDWTTLRAYQTDDLVIRDGAIWKSLGDRSAGDSFNVTEWQQLVGDTAQRSEPIQSSILFGGTVSLPTPGLVEVAAGSGVVVNNADPRAIEAAAVEWATFQFAPGTSTSPTLMLALNAAGVAQTLDPIPDNRRLNIELGTLIYDTNGNLIDIEQTGRRAADTAESFVDNYEARGGAFKASGVVLSGPGDLTLRTSAGSIFALSVSRESAAYNPNNVSVPAFDPMTFRRATQDGAFDVAETTIDPDRRDNNGLLVPVTPGEATIQYVMATSDLSQAFVQYGQTAYATLDAAKSALNDDVQSFNFGYPIGRSFVLIGAVIAVAGATTLGDDQIIDADSGRYPFAQSTGGGTGVDPSQYYRLDGSSPLEGDMDADGFEIRNVTVDGGDNSVLLHRRSETTGVVPSPGLEDHYGELFVNITDQKLYARNSLGEMALVADRISTYSDTRSYEVDDFCVESDILYRCNTRVDPPEVFDPGKWTQVGGASQNVILNPMDAGRNTITPDTDAEGLVIEGTASQTADLLRVPGTQAGDSGAATIDAQGFPTGHFAPNIVRVVQPSHDFSARGTALEYRSGTGFRLADGSNPATEVVGVVSAVIDANTFILRTGGVQDALDAGAFAGGSISDGTQYYLSATVDGQLTSVGGSGALKVLHTLTAGEAVVNVAPSPPEEATGFVQITGDTMTGTLEIETDGEAQFLKVYRTDAAADTLAGVMFRHSGANADHMAVRKVDSTGGAATDIARFDPEGEDAPDNLTIMTREKADARYAPAGSNPVEQIEGEIEFKVTDNEIPGAGNEAPQTGTGVFVRTGNLMYVRAEILNLDVSGLTQNTRMYLHLSETTSTGAFDAIPKERCLINILTDFISPRSSEVFIFAGMVEKANAQGGITIREVRDGNNNLTLNPSSVVSTNAYIQITGTYDVVQ